MRRMLAFVATGDHDAAHTRVHYNRFSPSPCTCPTDLWHSWTEVCPDKSAAPYRSASEIGRKENRIL
jgi:hypothetical protein